MQVRMAQDRDPLPNPRKIAEASICHIEINYFDSPLIASSLA